MGNELCDNTVNIAILCSAFGILPVLLAGRHFHFDIECIYVVFIAMASYFASNTTVYENIYAFFYKVKQKREKNVRLYIFGISI